MFGGFLFWNTVYISYVQGGRIARISVGGGGTGRAPNARESRSRGDEVWGGGVGRGCGEGVSLPTGDGVWGGATLPRIFFLSFFIKTVSCRAFWVASSCCLAARFTRIGSTCRAEHLLAIVPAFCELKLLPAENCAQKNDKMRQKSL